MILLSGKGRDAKIAFGPYLAISGAACIFLREDFVGLGSALAPILGL